MKNPTKEPQLLPIGLVSKRYSWRAEGFYTEIIQDVSFSNKNQPYYDLMLVVDDSCRCFTSISHERMMGEFRTKTRMCLEQKEFEDFVESHPFTVKTLKERKCIEELVRTFE